MKTDKKPVCDTEPDHLVGAAPRVGVREMFRRFSPDARPFRKWLALSLVITAIGPALDAASIWLFKILVDKVLTPHNFSAFPKVAIAYVVITLVQGFVLFGDIYLTAWIGENFLHRLRTRVFAHLQTLSVGFFDRSRLGDTLSRLTGDVGSIESLVLTAITSSVAYLFTICLYVGLMFYLDWRLALASLITVPVFALAARFFSRRITEASREVRQRSGSISVVAEEGLGNASLIQAYGLEESEANRFSGQSFSSVKAQLRATKLRAVFSPLTNLVEVTGVMAVIGVGVWELSHNRITLGGVLAFLVYLSQLYSPVRGLGSLSNTIYSAAASAERVIELLDRQPDVKAPENPIPLGHSRGLVSVESVTFRYPDTADNALHDVSFRVEPDRTVALVGASGAGKSTITKLLLRVHDPASGRITLDGNDLRELDPEELRANIAIVMQETLLLDGTIADNIYIGRPDATKDDVRRAARAADADDFITALPDGYATRVGQRGRLLSGGQRQRIAIARAMIRNAPILILDEPTTGLDNETRDRILVPLRRLMVGRATIMVSHNLLAVTGADQIVLLDHGYVTEIGTHSELLARGEAYARLYRLQHPDGMDEGVSVANGNVSNGKAPVITTGSHDFLLSMANMLGLGHVGLGIRTQRGFSGVGFGHARLFNRRNGVHWRPRGKGTQRPR